MNARLTLKLATARYNRALEKAMSGNPDVLEMNEARRLQGEAHAAYVAEIRKGELAAIVTRYASLVDSNNRTVRSVATSLRDSALAEVSR